MLRGHRVNRDASLFSVEPEAGSLRNPGAGKVAGVAPDLDAFGPEFATMYRSAQLKPFALEDILGERVG